MAYLLSKHDFYHIHAFLGLSCLIHFMYRIFLIIIYGTAFSNNNWNILFILLHLFLNLTSFYFDLNKERNLNKPIIWDEFRFHSLLFVTRHVICTINHYIMPDIWFKYNLNILIVLIVNKFASIITNKYGNLTNRTTNKMPYPDDLDKGYVDLTKKFYTSAQFGATCFAIYGDKMLCFIPLLGLQISPFMMTLIKKNKINTNTYHFIYSLGLYINYPVWLIICFINIYNNDNVEDLVLLGLCYNIVVNLKLKYNLNKYVCWSLGWFICLVFKNLFNLNNYYVIYLYILNNIILSFYLLTFLSWTIGFKFNWTIKEKIVNIFYNTYK